MMVMSGNDNIHHVLFMTLFRTPALWLMVNDNVERRA